MIVIRDLLATFIFSKFFSTYLCSVKVTKVTKVTKTDKVDVSNVTKKRPKNVVNVTMMLQNVWKGNGRGLKNGFSTTETSARNYIRYQELFAKWTWNQELILPH